MGSRTQAAQWVRQGRVRVNGQPVHDAEQPVHQGIDRIDIDGRECARAARRVLMLNKPRGLVTTRADEQGRATVYSCFAGAALPWIAPVGRLDKASEGLLLFSNDPEWAAHISDAGHGAHGKLPRTYHVQINQLASAALLGTLEQGVMNNGERLCARRARCLRSGQRHAWLEIVLEEGRNRQIRVMLAELQISVLRLVRVAIGPLELGELPKGQWRELTQREIESL